VIEADNSRIRRHAPNGVIVLNFGVWGAIADVITYGNVFVNRFRGLGVLTPRNFAISIGLAGRSHKSVSTAVLHCDTTEKDFTRKFTSMHTPKLQHLLSDSETISINKQTEWPLFICNKRA